MNLKYNKIQRRAKRLYALLLCLTLTMVVMVAPSAAAAASPSPTITDPLAIVSNLSNFIFSLIRAVGLSFQSHDPSQCSNGMLTVAGGIVITFTREILNLITGGI